MKNRRTILLLLIFLFISVRPLASQEDEAKANKVSTRDQEILKSLSDRNLKYDAEWHNPSGTDNDLEAYVVGIEVSSFIDDSDLKEIVGFTHLEELRVFGDLTDNGLTCLSDLKSLRSLKLTSRNVTDDGLTTIANFDSLSRLDIRFTNIQGSDLSSIAELTNLIDLRLPLSNQIGDEQISQISSLSSLVRLQVSNSRISDASIGEIVKLSKLKSLDISSSKITDEGARKLTELPELKYLNLDGVRLRRETVDFLEANCENLERIFGK